MPNRATDLALKVGGCLYSSIAMSAAVTNTTTETTMDSVSVGADQLRPGDILRIVAQGIATATNSTDTLPIKIKIGSTVLCATAAVDVADNDVWVMQTHGTIRTGGASGTLVAAGHQSLGVEGTATARADILASTAVDTTGALTVAVTATWSVANAGNSCRNDTFYVEILRPSSFS